MIFSQYKLRNMNDHPNFKVHCLNTQGYCIYTAIFICVRQADCSIVASVEIHFCT
jgi:hypothetical protein